MGLRHNMRHKDADTAVLETYDKMLEVTASIYDHYNSRILFVQNLM